MTSILIILALILAVALLFWLDRKDREDKDEREKICDEVFRLFDRIDWGNTLAELREVFSDKELEKLEEDANSFVGTCYRDKLDGQDISVRFYFPKDENGKIIRAEIQFTQIQQNKLDNLFSKLCERYGAPSLPDETGEKPVFWDTENGILTFETSSGQKLLLSLWIKQLYENNEVKEEV